MTDYTMLKTSRGYNSLGFLDPHSGQSAWKHALAQETGFYLIFSIFFIVAVLSLCAFVLGLGYVVTSQNRLQQAVDGAALGALVAYVETKPPANFSPSDAETSHTLKAGAALTRVHELMGLNRLPGLREAQSAIELSDAPQDQRINGTLEFGEWVTADREPHPCPAQGLPCFLPFVNQRSGRIPNTSEIGVATAVRLQVKSPANAFSVPFLALLGGDRGISATAIAGFTGRCVVFGLDISESVTYETHRQISGNSVVTIPPEPTLVPPRSHASYRVMANPAPSLAYYSLNRVMSATGPLNCLESPVNLNEQRETSFVYWCNMQDWELDPEATSPFYPPYDETAEWGPYLTRWGPTEPTSHFMSDYFGSLSAVQNVSRYDPSNDRILADTYMDDTRGYIGPQPFGRFMLAINSGLRMMDEQATNSDKVATIVFNRNFIEQIPPEGDGFTRDFGYLQHLTNLTNVGGFHRTQNGYTYRPPHPPNYLSRGWYSLHGEEDNNSNLIRFMDEALDLLGDVNLCPADAQKSIVIFTDGISTCRPDADHPDEPQFDICGARRLQYDTVYQAAEAILLGRILTRMQTSHVAFTAIMDGSHIGPNIRNVAVNGRYINDFNTAHALGYSAEEIMNLTSETIPCGAFQDDGCAFQNAGVSGVKFRKPLGTLATLSMGTGGQFCPLMDPCPQGCYDNQGELVWCRTGEYQECAVQNVSKNQQAVDCVLKTLGDNPFVLLAENLPGS